MDDIGDHGQPMSEATSPLADPSSWAAEYGYEGTGPFFDFAEKAKQERIEAVRAKYPDGKLPPGFRFGVRKVLKTPRRPPTP